MSQRSIFDLAERKKQEGINLSYHNSDSIWKKAAGEALIAVAKQNQSFTTDEVWAYLANLGIHTGENRAIGGVIQSGIRAGVMVHTGNYRKTDRKEAHKRPISIYQSKIWSPK